MEHLDRPIYRVGEIEIDPARNCLRREDEEWTLRQKSLQVLLYLLEHRERLVTKEELIETVWAGVAVTDDALVQIIVELRKTLGDDSRHPRFIRTIPKIGYHFIGPVERIDSGQLIEYEEVTSVQVEIDQVTGSSPGRFLQRLAAIPGRHVVLASVGIGLALVLTVGWLWSEGERTNTDVTVASFPGKKPVAVMYFENRAGDRELDWLREGLADMLIASLSRSQRLTLLSRQQLTTLLNQTGHQNTERIELEDGIEIARRAQAEMMILGGFARLGDRVRIDVSLHDARTGQLRAAETLIADRPEQILTQIDLLALKLANHLGATLADTDARSGLAAVMTNNLDAYRYYSLALEQAQMFQFHESIALLEKALALDPEFALAHARIGYVYAVRMGQGEKAKSYLEKALAGRLSEKDRLFVAAWQASAARNPERAIEIYRDINSRYPMETEGWQRLSWLLQTQNRNEEALEVIRQGLVTDPEWKDLYNSLGTVCMRLGRNEEALAAFQRYIQLAPNDPNAWDSLGLFHQWVGEFEQAEASYNRALALNPESGVAIIHLGHLRFQQGRYRAAAEQYRRLIRIARDDSGRARGFHCLAWLHRKQGQLAQAVAAANEEVRYNPTSAWNTYALALERGDRAAAAKLESVVFAPATYELYKERGMLRLREYQRGYAALRQGRAEEALGHFRAALRHRALEWNIDSFEDCLANALLELGRWDEAIAEYERILKNNPNYPLARYHLAQAREGKGDRALEAYQDFLRLWKDADPDIPEVIEAKRRIDLD
ncbi:MAG: tetratricopeptide repeat protein [Acidobacteriota bacterium]|nr:MAG: tetratricopeptide repeat protein [Acidobacteriota bacterium]